MSALFKLPASGAYVERKRLLGVTVEPAGPHWVVCVGTPRGTYGVSFKEEAAALAYAAFVLDMDAPATLPLNTFGEVVPT